MPGEALARQDPRSDDGCLPVPTLLQGFGNFFVTFFVKKKS